jgi:hypothetical protein
MKYCKETCAPSLEERWDDHPRSKVFEEGDEYVITDRENDHPSAAPEGTPAPLRPTRVPPGDEPQRCANEEDDNSDLAQRGCDELFDLTERVGDLALLSSGDTSTDTEREQGSDQIRNLMAEWGVHT